MNCELRRFLPAVFAWLALSAVALGAAGQASQHVRQGIRYYGQGDYEAAARAFADADVALSDDLRIAFDRACVHAARGETEQSIELFRAAALSREASLSARSHYNLGCTRAAQAKALFGEEPEEASPQVREQGLQHLAQAVAHFRDCLRVDPEHEGSRHNLEVLRLWIKHMRELWAERDRQKQRDEMDLLQFLQMIQSEQELLRRRTRSLTKENDSPQRRQEISETESAQRQLADEHPTLEQKIADALQPTTTKGSGPGQAQSVGEREQEKILAALTDLTRTSRASMLLAADKLVSAALPEALQAQAEALDALNQLYMSVAPFADVLRKSTTTQQQLVDQSTAYIEASLQAMPEGDAPDEEADFEELARRQLLVEGWSGVLPQKAEVEINRLEAAAGGSEGSASDDRDAPSAEEAQQQQQTSAALRSSFEKAIELAPKIQQLTHDAGARLAEKDVIQAFPQQEEALKLLKEIAESLPKQQPNEQQDQQNEEQQKEREQQDQQDPSQQRSGSDQQQEQPGELSKDQIEALLSKVRERQQQHQEQKEQLRGRVRGTIKVEQDW